MEKITEIKKQAYDLACRYEMDYGCCSQCVLAALKDTVGGEKISDSVFLSATGLGAGLAGAGYSCGALTGGIMALSCFKGRERSNFSDPDGKRFDTFRMARKLVDRFEAEYGVNGGDCSAVQTRLLGRSFDIVRGSREEFLAAGGHDIGYCPTVCGKSAVWVIEILDEEGLL